jgi:hypothetical protein
VKGDRAIGYLEQRWNNRLIFSAWTCGNILSKKRTGLRFSFVQFVQ